MKSSTSRFVVAERNLQNITFIFSQLKKKKIKKLNLCDFEGNSPEF